MKRNKLYAIVLCLLATAVSASTQDNDYSFLTFQYGGIQQSVALSSLKKITFSGGKLIATTTEGSESFELSTMEKMFFSSTPTAVSAPSVREGELTWDAASQTIHANGGNGSAVLNVYFMNGATALRTTVPAEGATVSLASLPQGIYIVKMNRQTLKINRK